MNTTKTFRNIWYRSKEKKLWNILPLIAYEDVGSLTITGNSLVFDGRKNRISITNVRRLSFGKLGIDLYNMWVKVEYDGPSGPSSACFSDGGGMGWGGILGGTAAILAALQPLSSSPAVLMPADVISRFFFRLIIFGSALAVLWFLNMTRRSGAIDPSIMTKLGGLSAGICLIGACGDVLANKGFSRRIILSVIAVLAVLLTIAVFKLL
jgi:hypothetical protein